MDVRLLRLAIAALVVISPAGAARMACAEELAEAPATAPPPLPESSPSEVLAPSAPGPEATEAEALKALAEDAPAPEAAAPEVVEPVAAPESVVRAPLRRNSRIPAYTLTRPSWGVSITGSLDALGGGDLLASQAGLPTRAFMMAGEYQFPFLQSIGVLSLGPSAGIYPILGAASPTSNAASIWEVGGGAHYQARFFREQILVPTVGYEVQYLNYRFKDGPRGNTLAQGPVFGLMLLLNWIEPATAAESYVNNGISRSYLVAELKGLSANDANLSISGQSLFFGLRLEF